MKRRQPPPSPAAAQGGSPAPGAPGYTLGAKRFPRVAFRSPPPPAAKVDPLRAAADAYQTGAALTLGSHGHRPTKAGG